MIVTFGNSLAETESATILRSPTDLSLSIFLLLLLLTTFLPTRPSSYVLLFILWSDHCTLLLSWKRRAEGFKNNNRFLHCQCLGKRYVSQTIPRSSVNPPGCFSAILISKNATKKEGGKCRVSYGCMGTLRGDDGTFPLPQGCQTQIICGPCWDSRKRMRRYQKLLCEMPTTLGCIRNQVCVTYYVHM